MEPVEMKALARRALLAAGLVALAMPAPADRAVAVGGEPGGDVVAMRLDLIGEAERILERLAGPLGEVLQHRVRRIAQEDDAVARPLRDRGPVVHRPAPVAPDPRQGFAHRAAGP